jgi:hypothetical protein
VVVVEEEREEPHVRALRFRLFVEGRANRPRRGRLVQGVDLEQFERRHLLRRAVLPHLEVALLQVTHRLPLLVGDDAVDPNEVDAGTERRLRRRGLIGGRLRGGLALRGRRRRLLRRLRRGRRRLNGRKRGRPDCDGENS